VSGGLFIGLMSGTSADGIDAVLIDSRCDATLLASRHRPMPPALREEVLAFRHAGANELHRQATLGVQLADEYAAAVSALLTEADVVADQVTAIGQHGQTLRHHPVGDTPYTVQIGDPNRLAELTGITVVADFRRRDIAAGGQGAPLVPAFHAAHLATPGVATAVVNIGGIANVTLVSADGAVSGWDTGPGNTLLDAWVSRHQGASFDDGGGWAATGATNRPLLENMLREPYFARALPKSTGPELFNLDWLHAHLAGDEPPADVQRTLLELTAETIAGAITPASPDVVRVCGGGALNTLLMERLTDRLRPAEITTTEAVGVDPCWVEAWAFAWLAERTLAGLPGNVPDVTGASGPRVLGGIYPGRG